MKFRAAAPLVVLFLVSCVREPSVDPELLFGHVAELASEEYAGRRTGTEGNRRAVAYIRSRFELYGLEEQLQSFRHITLEMASAPTLEIIGRNGEVTDSFVHLIDFRANHHWAGIRTEGAAEAELFLIEEREELFSLPEEADGKILLLKREIVKGMRVTSLLNTLRGSGHRIPALIIRYDSRQQSGYYSYGTYTGWHNGNTNPDGPFIFFCIDGVYEKLRRFAVNLPEAADRDSKLPAASEDPDSNGSAAAEVSDPKTSAAGRRVRLTMDTGFPEVESSNVIGTAAGRGEGTLIISAHLDHVGVVGDDVYCPGALDNASGVAVLLELARMTAEYRREPEQTIVFAAFNGEEQDLFGSRHYVENPLFPLEGSACVNLDMVGSSGDLPLTVSTLRSGNDVTDAILRTAEKTGVEYERVSDVWNSDHASFAHKNIPAVLLTHQDYTYLHTPLDKPETAVDSERMAAVASALFSFILEYAYGEEPVSSPIAGGGKIDYP